MSINFSLDTKKLQKIVNNSNQVSPKKSDIEVFTETLVTLKNKQITLENINSSTYLKTTLNISDLSFSETEETKFLIKTDILASSINLINEEIVSFQLDLDKHTLLLQSSKSKHTLRVTTENLDNFIIPASNKNNQLLIAKINSSEFTEAVRSSSISVGNAKQMFADANILNICLTVDYKANQIFVVSTDRFRVTKNVLKAELENVETEIQNNLTNFLVPPRSLQLLTGMLEENTQANLSFESDFLKANLNDTVLLVKYGEGNYPDFEKIIPQTFACSLTLNTKDFLDALKQTYLFAKNNVINKSVKLNFLSEDNTLIISSQTDDGYSSETKISVISYEGAKDNWEQSFNADYLIDYVNLVKTENLIWEANPGRPVVVSPEKEKSKQLYLVSGLR